MSTNSYSLTLALRAFAINERTPRKAPTTVSTHTYRLQIVKERVAVRRKFPRAPPGPCVTYWDGAAYCEEGEL